MHPRESLAHLDSKLPDKTRAVDQKTQTKNNVNKGDKDEEKEEKEAHDMIEDKHVIVNTIDVSDIANHKFE